VVKFVFDTLEFSIPFVNTFTRPDSAGNVECKCECRRTMLCRLHCIQKKKKSVRSRNWKNIHSREMCAARHTEGRKKKEMFQNLECNPSYYPSNNSSQKTYSLIRQKSRQQQPFFFYLLLILINHMKESFTYYSGKTYTVVFVPHARCSLGKSHTHTQLR
jgi:hypothetical protein